MDQVVPSETHQQEGDSNNVVSSSLFGQLVPIEAIAIDLGKVQDLTPNGSCAHHFSIREYVAEMRKKDECICSPFPFGDNNTGQMEPLPPLDVRRFRWWRCHNCLRETEIAYATEVAQTDVGSRSAEPSQNMISDDATALQLGMQLVEVPKPCAIEEPANPSRPRDNAPGGAVNSDNGTASGGDGERSEKDLPIPESNLLLLTYNERLVDNAGEKSRKKTRGSKTRKQGVAIRKSFLSEHSEDRHGHISSSSNTKSTGLLATSEKILNSNNVHSTAPFCEFEKNGNISNVEPFNSVDDEHITAVMASETLDDDAPRASKFSFLEGKECQKELSGNDDLIGGSRQQLQCPEGSSGFPRRKPKKVRLMAELLGCQGNSQLDSTRVGNASPRALSPTPGQLVIAPPSQASVPDGVEKKMIPPPRKRKFYQEEGSKQQDIGSSNVAKKTRVPGGADSEKSLTTADISGSGSEGKAGYEASNVGVVAQPLNRRSDKRTMPSRKKNKQAADNFRQLVKPLQEAPIANHTENCDAQRTSGFLKQKGKMAAVENGECGLMTKRNNKLGESTSTQKKSSEKKQTSLEAGNLHLAHDASSGEELDFSLDSMIHLERNTIEGGPRNENKTGQSYIQQRGNTGVQRKYSNFAENLSAQWDANCDESLRNGLPWDLNDNMSQPPLPSCEKENFCMISEDRSTQLQNKMELSSVGYKGTAAKGGIALTDEPRQGRKGKGNAMGRGITSAEDSFARCGYGGRGISFGTSNSYPYESFEQFVSKGKVPEFEGENIYRRGAQKGSGIVLERGNAFAENSIEWNTDKGMEVVEGRSAYAAEPLVQLSSKRKGIVIGGEKTYAHDSFGRSYDKGNRVVPEVGDRNINPSFRRNHHKEKEVVIEGRKRYTDKSEDIPMEIVEMLAKNQYERGLSERNDFSPVPRTHNILREYPVASEKRSTGWSPSPAANLKAADARGGFMGAARRSYLNLSEVTRNHGRIGQADESQFKFFEEIPPEEASGGMQYPAISLGRSRLQHGAGAETVWFSSVQKGSIQSNLQGTLDVPNFMQKGKTVSDIKVSESTMQNESFAFLPKALRSELIAKAAGNLDPYSNEAIPAMQLLSLMDKRTSSSSRFDPNKFFEKPFTPYNNHPKFSMDERQNFLDEASFPQSSKELSGLHPSFHGGRQRSRHTSSSFYGHMPFKYPDEGRSRNMYAFPQPASNKGQKFFSATGDVQGAHDLFKSKGKQKGGLDVSGSMEFSRVLGPVEYPQRGRTISFSGWAAIHKPGSVHAAKSTSGDGICSINRNPADFSVPEPSNSYTINGTDLSLMKTSSKRGRRSADREGQRRKRTSKRKESDADEAS